MGLTIGSLVVFNVGTVGVVAWALAFAIVGCAVSAAYALPRRKRYY